MSSVCTNVLIHEHLYEREKRVGVFCSGYFSGYARLHAVGNNSGFCTVVCRISIRRSHWAILIFTILFERVRQKTMCNLTNVRFVTILARMRKRCGRGQSHCDWPPGPIALAIFVWPLSVFFYSLAPSTVYRRFVVYHSREKVGLGNCNKCSNCYEHRWLAYHCILCWVFFGSRRPNVESFWIYFRGTFGLKSHQFTNSISWINLFSAHNLIWSASVFLGFLLWGNIIY